MILIAASALAIIVTVLAIVWAHRAGESSFVLFESWLANIFACAKNSQIVALDASRTYLLR